MTRQTAAVMLALLVAAAPVLATVCELNCDAPRSAPQACHKLAANDAGGSLRDASRDCRHQHISLEASLTNANVRDFVANPFVALVPTSALLAIAAERRASGVCGPPGVNAHVSTPLTTVLRI